jgi:hypothetical protein
VEGWSQIPKRQPKSVAFLTDSFSVAELFMQSAFFLEHTFEYGTQQMKSYYRKEAEKL